MNWNVLTYWLYDAVITTPLPLSWLTAGNVALLLNRPAHGASCTQLLATLWAACVHGHLGVYRQPDFDEWTETPQRPTRAELQAALAHQVDSSYGLTALGGRAWESYSRPQWSRYLVQNDTHPVRVRAGSQAQLHAYLERYTDFNNEETIIPQTIAWQQARPWRATYWKTLPVGYEARFTTMPTEREPLPYAVHLQRIQERAALLRWYTNPFPDRA